MISEETFWNLLDGLQGDLSGWESSPSGRMLRVDSTLTVHVTEFGQRYVTLHDSTSAVRLVVSSYSWTREGITLTVRDGLLLTIPEPH